MRKIANCFVIFVAEMERKKLNNLFGGLNMGNFFKTMAVLAMLCVTGFAQEVNLNVSSQENPQERFEHFTKMKKVGTGLIIGGAVLGTTSVVLAAVHAVKADNYVDTSYGGINYFLTDADKDNYFKELGKSAGWFIVGYLGYSAMTAGIPIRIVGRVKAQQWKNKMPTAYIIPNGAKFTWNF